jgi:ribose transport system substrate-binding protein
MKPSERRRQIMELLLQNGTVHLSKLVQLLQVSEGTVRNDLRLLEKQSELIRTHGGAVIGSRPPSIVAPHKNVTNDQEQIQRAIQNIAKRSASLVDEGDIILLAGGLITQEMANELLPLKSLTVLTNSMPIATTLSRNPSQTVILIGGQLRPERDTLEGHTAAAMLRELRVQKAFMSCDGISVSRGFADDDIASAELKMAMLPCAQKVIMVVTGERLGKTALISFASLRQIHYLVTTENASAETLSALRATGVQISLCGEYITEVSSDPPQGRRWRIGFANLTEKQEFAVSVRQSIERAAIDNGCIDLLLADNDARPDVALNNARRLIEAKVDLVIEYQQDEQTNNVIMDLFRSATVPVIAIDIPLPGATFFGADNYRAGRIGGDAAARWINEHWMGKVDRVVCLEQPESGPVPAARIQGQIDGLCAKIPLACDCVVHLSTRGDLEGSQLAATQALRNIPWGKYVLFIGINANSALGALAAVQTLDRQRHTAVISQNASGRIRRELIKHNPLLIGAVDYFPQNYGVKTVQLAQEILTGRPTPPAVYTDHLLITGENVMQIYHDDSKETHELITSAKSQITRPEEPVKV